MTIRKGLIISLITILIISIGLIGGLISMNFQELKKASAAAKTIGNYSFYEMSEETPIDYTDCFTYSYYKNENNVYAARITGLTDKGKNQEILATPLLYNNYAVESIATNAFATQRLQNCKKFTLSNNIKYVGVGTFSYCENLETIVIGNGVTIIYESAFSDCHNLRNIVLGANVNEIQRNAFAMNYNLPNIIIPLSVSTIGSAIFSGNTNLITIKCRAQSQPEGWSVDWLFNCPATVEWGYNGN